LGTSPLTNNVTTVEEFFGRDLVLIKAPALPTSPV
jgi:hypothetical protein